MADRDWRDLTKKKDETLYYSGTTYEEFINNEGIPVHEGFAIDDVGEAEVGEWHRTGGNAAFVNLRGHEEINNILLQEIPAGESLEMMSPMYEEIVVVIEGQGATRIRDPETGEEYTFEWDDGSMFFLPRNAFYQHINLSDEPARLMEDTDMPMLFRLFRDEEHIYSDDPAVVETPDEFDADGSLEIIPGVPAIWEANFIPDLSKFDQLADYGMRGAGGANVKFKFPLSKSIRAHMSEFPVGTYKKAHKHAPGANLFVVSGEGFSLMWPPGEFDDHVKFDWSPGSLVVPPTHWYHQHFNAGGTPARYIALHAPNVFPYDDQGVFNPKKPEHFLEYTEESPEIREIFEAELAERGVESRMPDECYEDPDYEFDMDYEPAAGAADD